MENPVKLTNSPVIITKANTLSPYQMDWGKYLAFVTLNMTLVGCWWMDISTLRMRSPPISTCYPFRPDSGILAKVREHCDIVSTQISRRRLTGQHHPPSHSHPRNPRFAGWTEANWGANAMVAGVGNFVNFAPHN